MISATRQVQSAGGRTLDLLLVHREATFRHFGWQRLCLVMLDMRHEDGEIGKGCEIDIKGARALLRNAQRIKSLPMTSPHASILLAYRSFFFQV